MERTQPSASGTNGKTEQSTTPYCQGDVHFTTRPPDSPSQPGSWGLELTGSSDSGGMGVSSLGGRGRRLSCVPSPIPQPSLQQPLLSVACMLTASLPWTLSTGGLPPTPLQKQVLQELTSPEWISPKPLSHRVIWEVQF